MARVLHDGHHGRHRGFREIHPLSRAGEAFTLLLILVGVSTALYAFSVFAAVVVEGGWPAIGSDGDTRA